MAQNERVKLAAKDTLPAKIESKDEVILISIRMEGDLLDALKKAAASEGKPYQTLMKQLLREKLEIGEAGELAREMEKLKEDVKELKAGYKELAVGRKKLVDTKKHPRSARGRTKRSGSD